MPIPPVGWGAVEILIWDYYQELIKLGHEVQIVNTPNQKEIITQVNEFNPDFVHLQYDNCLLYTSPSPRDYAASRMPSSAWKKKFF